MRICHDMAELERGFHVASTEAANAFDNPDLYLEKLIIRPRHVEIQVIGDKFGNIVHLGERDCSIQRRHQKLIEETPSPIMSESLRYKMGQAAIKGAAYVNYLGVGTIEFLVDDKRNFYFMEMNTRIQVEHPVTEEAYEIDLVKEQIRIALGEKISFKQEQLVPKWAVIECRINAEDPDKDFRPGPGKITGLHIPGGYGVRVDKAVYTGYTIPPFYDSMIAKVITRSRTREGAIKRMRNALDEFIIEGVPTTIPFHQRIFELPEFVAGDYDIGFVETVYKQSLEKKVLEEAAVSPEKPVEATVSEPAAVPAPVLEPTTTSEKEQKV